MLKNICKVNELSLLIKKIEKSRLKKPKAKTREAVIKSRNI